MTSDTTLTTLTTETKFFCCHLSMGILATQIFRCYLSMTILTISNLRCHTHFFRCHLRMGQKVLLLFKYEFFETLILTQSQKIFHGWNLDPNSMERSKSRASKICLTQNLISCKMSVKFHLARDESNKENAVQGLQTSSL